jgi:hypothetical protein
MARLLKGRAKELMDEMLGIEIARKDIEPLSLISLQNIT